MPTRIATGLSAGDAGPDSFAEAAAQAALGLGGAEPSIALVFAGGRNLAHVRDGLAAMRERLPGAAVVGCGAQGVVGDAHEMERGGVVVWAASFAGGSAETFHAGAVPAGENRLTITGIPDLERADLVVLLVDPSSFPVEPLLGRLGEQEPGLPIVGGLASGSTDTGRAALMHGGELLESGAVGAVLSGVDVRACVSQGARPVGPEMIVTAGEGNVVHELAGLPALERLRGAIDELDAEERALAARGLLLGIVIDGNRPEYERGDFLVRGLVGVDEESGAVTVGERVRVGQAVRMQVRDATSADEDLDRALSVELSGESPAGALLFTCNGRGTGMFGAPDHDAGALARAFSGAPVAGFFCAGEIGPVGGRNFVHGFTATIAAFR